MVYKILMTGMSPVLAGTETFIMNYYRHLDSSIFQVDFLKGLENLLYLKMKLFQKVQKFIIYLVKEKILLSI